MTGEVLSRITTDTTLILSVIGSSVSVALRNVLMLLGGLVLLFLTSAKLTGLVLLIVPAVVVPIIVLGRRLRRLSAAKTRTGSRRPPGRRPRRCRRCRRCRPSPTRRRPAPPLPR